MLGDRPDGERWMPGRKQLAHHAELEGRMEDVRDLGCHRHAAAQHAEDHGVRRALGEDRRAELTAGIEAIEERHASGSSKRRADDLRRVRARISLWTKRVCAKRAR